MSLQQPLTAVCGWDCSPCDKPAWGLFCMPNSQSPLRERLTQNQRLVHPSSVAAQASTRPYRTEQNEHQLLSCPVRTSSPALQAHRLCEGSGGRWPRGTAVGAVLGCWVAEDRGGKGGGGAGHSSERGLLTSDLDGTQIRLRGMHSGKTTQVPQQSGSGAISGCG